MGMRMAKVPQLVPVAKANAEHSHFLCREDLAERSGVGRSVVDKLAEIGALGDLPESNAISLF